MPQRSANVAPPRSSNLLWARWIDDRHIRVEYEWAGLPNAVAAGTINLRVQPGRTYDLDVRLDPVEHAIEVKYRKGNSSSAASPRRVRRSHPDPRVPEQLAPRPERSHRHDP